MTIGYLLVAAILFSCILADRFSGKFGMPALILFMAVGMIFGSDGIFKIQFNNYDFAEKVCSAALIFIMFYGGFNTKWKTAKSVAARAILLSTAGVLVTAGLTAVFCHFVLHFNFVESFLIGAVLSSTDAASVFSILRGKNLNLKDGTAPLLEIESGSNDPMSYLLTVIGISMLGVQEMGSITWMIFSQIVFGILVGILTAVLGIFLMTKVRFVPEGQETIFVIAIVIFAFGFAELIGGNSYLSVYLLGILLGNSPVRHKDVMIPFFDGVTGLAQIMIFFLLGLLAFPHKMPVILPAAILIALFLTFIARPIAVFGILLPFRCSIRQCTLVSWSGLRGAASIVFAIMVIASGGDISFDLFHIVFTVALLSVAFQGTLIPALAKKLDMVDDSADVKKTFNDYQEESAMTLMRMYIPKGHNWENRRIREVGIPTGALALMIKRDGDTMIPNGDTKILAEDSVILSIPAYESKENENLEEVIIDKDHDWCNCSIQELNLPQNQLIALIKREEENVIPSGGTVIQEGDIVVLYK